MNLSKAAEYIKKAINELKNEEGKFGQTIDNLESTVRYLTSYMARKLAEAKRDEPAEKPAKKEATQAKPVKPAAKKEVARTNGLEEYRNLQKKCKELGLSGKGSKAQLLERLAQATASPPAQAAAAAQTAAPAAKPPKTATLDVPAEKFELLRRLSELDTETLRALLELGSSGEVISSHCELGELESKM